MKRPILSLASAVLFGTLPCFADPVVLPPDAPAPQAPAPQASVQLVPETVNATVLVVPFASAGNGDREWISKGIQQDLTADLIRSSRLHVVAPTDLPPAQDADAALKVGRDNHAAFVIFGQFQVVDSNVRITGQVLETTGGQSIGALKATGPTRDLFNMEDALSGQVISALPKHLLAENTTEPTPMPYVYQPSQPPAQTAPAPTYSDESGYYTPQTQTYVQAPSPDDYSYTPQTYTPDYDNYGYAPSYPYYYNYWYPGYGFVVIGGHHHHDGDHGHWSDGHNHGFVGTGRASIGAHISVGGGFAARAPSISHTGGGFHASGGFGGGMHGGGGGGHR